MKTFYHLENRDGLIEIWLSGGKLVKKKFRPYFLVGRDEEKLVSGYIDKEYVRVKVRGIDREMVKFYFLDDKSRKKAAKGLREVFNLELSPWEEFLLDTGLEPFSEVDESLNPVGESSLDSLTKLYFSGIVYSEDGFPIEGKSPVVALAYAVNDGPVEVIYTKDMDDGSVLRDFIDVVRKVNPDAIIGYGQDADELQHMTARAKVNGLRLALGRDGEEPVQTGRFFRGMILVEQRVRGRANIDMFPIAWRDFPQLPMRTWYELADEIGVSRPKVLMKFRIPDLWKRDPDSVIGYLRAKLETIREISNKLLPNQVELSRLVLRPIHYLIRSPVGEIVESYVFREAYSKKWAIPGKSPGGGGYAGGYVWLRSPGIYEEVGYLDFASMYPSIMASHNISVETVNPPEGLCDVEPITAEGITAKVCRNYQGILSEIIEKLLKMRSELKSKMKKLPEGSPEWRRLDAIQRAVKVITNATYGYLGWEGACFKNPEAAKLVAALGRYYIKRVREIAEDKGFKTVYIDTDGIQLIGGRPEDYQELIDLINERFPLRIELEYVADRAIYLTKKKYAHLVDGKLIAKGFEFVRRDYPNIVKEAQRKVVEMLLQGESLDRIRAVVRDYVKRIEELKVEKEDLIIIETIGKEIEKFERRTKGYYVAKWLKEKKGIEVHRGRVRRILIVKGGGSINERARPAEFFSIEDVDKEYYIRLLEQVIERTLEAAKSVIREEKGAGLEEWLA